MKKSFALLMALTAALSVSATTLFFKPNANWRIDNARFAVKTPSTWFDLALVPGEDGIYSAVVGDLPDNVIFYRMDPSKKENILANKWNETNEMSIPYGENLYIMDEGVWDRGGGYWTKYAATPAEGSLYMWNGIGSTSKGTEVGGDSWVSKSDERVLVGAGQRGNSCLKINGDLAGGYYIGIELKNGSVNAEDQIVLADFRTSDDKSYRLSIQFFADVNASSPQASFMTTADPQVLAEEGAPAQSTFTVPAGVSNATYLRVCRTSGEACIWVAKLELIKKGSAPDPGPGPEPQPEDPTVTVIGSMTDWSAEIPFVLSADKKTATLSEDKIPAGTYEFKIKLNGEWRSNAQTFDRDHASASGITGNESNNMKLVADVEGKYTFTWTFETNALEIVFPDKDPTPGPGPEPQDPTVTVIGSMTDWSAEIPFVLSADKKTATLSEDKIPAGTYEFKIKLNGEWRSNAQTFDRDHASASGITGNESNNMKLVADVEGKYTFIWTFETNALEVVFPETGGTPPAGILSDGYYLVGSITDWKPVADNHFVLNTGSESEEYQLDILLAAGDEVKAVKVENEAIVAWYPAEGGNLVVDADHAGQKTVYFRPNYDGGEDWFAACLFIPANGGEGIEDLNASEKAVKVIRNGQIVILKGDKAFNILGSQVD